MSNIEDILNQKEELLKQNLKAQKQKQKENFKEFKQFAFKGNIVDLSIGVIIGAAFSKIVTSFSSDIIVPFISLLTNNINFENLFIALDGKTYETIELAKEANVPILYYGNFIATITNFLITAICIFIAIKLIQKFSFKKQTKIEEKQAITTKECEYCKTLIPIQATRCPNCTSVLTKEESQSENT